MTQFNKMFEFIFICIGVFLTSVFYWTNAPVPFEVPKVIFFQWFVRILALVFAVSLLVKKRVWEINIKLLLPILIFAVWATITSILGSDISKSFAGNYFREDGLITLYELIGFSILVSYFWREKYKSIISKTFFVSLFLLSALALSEILNHKFGLGSAATFGNPVFLAGYLVCGLPFYFYFLQNIKLAKIWKLVLYLFPILTVILTKTSGAIAVMVIYLGFEIARKVSKKYRLLLLITGFVISITIAFFWLNDFKKEKFMSPQGRDRIYHRVFVGALQKPIFGWGWANVDYAFESNYWPLKVYHDIYVDKAHSIFLEITATTGFPGILIYFYLLFIFLKELINKYKKTGNKLWNFTLLSTASIYLIHSQTNVISVSEEIIFWLIVGIALSRSQKPSLL